MSDTPTIQAVTAFTGTAGLDEASLRRLAGKGPGDEKRLVEVANQLEGVFMSMLVKTMRETMSETDIFGEVPGAEVYGGLFDQLMGEELSRRGGLGVAEMIVRASARDAEGVPLADALAVVAARGDSRTAEGGDAIAAEE